MRVLRAVAAGLIAVVFPGFAVHAQESPSSEPAGQQDRKARIAERDRLWEQAEALEKAGKVEEALQALEAVLAIEREVFGEVHEEVADTLGWFAALERSRENFPAARTVRERVLAIETQLHGVRHWRVTDARFELEDLRRWEGLTAEQRARLRETEELNRAVFELWRNGAYREAVPKAERALAIRREILGSHPLTALSCYNLGAQYAALGAYDKAEPLYRQALGIRRNVLDATFAVQSERQQFQMTRLFRGTLDAYLSLSALADVSAAEAYVPMLAWKGAVFARQAQARLMTKDTNVASLFAEFEGTSRLLATLCLSTPKPAQLEARRRQIAELTEKREELERELSLKSEAYRAVRAAKRLAASDLQRALPAGVALVDFLEYSKHVREDNGKRSERHLVAFVVPAKGKIQRVDLAV